MVNVPPKRVIDTAQREALSELIDFAGGQAHLSKMIDVPVSTVKNWVSCGRISVRGARKAQLNSYIKEHFPLSKLRPDLNY